MQGGAIGGGQGLLAAVDGFLPFVDPFAAMGAYDPFRSEMYVSQVLGGVSLGIFTSTGALRGAASLSVSRSSGVFHTLNHNRFVRLGPGRFGREMVPALRIGNFTSEWGRYLSHYNLRIFGW